MSLYRRFPTDRYPSFITTNTHERRPIFRSETACELFTRTLYEVREEAGFRLLAFSVMFDHVHLILATETEELGQPMQLIKGRFARVYNQAAGRTGAVWQSRYHERTLRTEAALLRAIEYVTQNPVAARLAASAEDYRWSSASGLYETDLDDYLGLG